MKFDCETLDEACRRIHDERVLGYDGDGMSFFWRYEIRCNLENAIEPELDRTNDHWDIMKFYVQKAREYKRRNYAFFRRNDV